ncbi:sterol esterase from carbohydrate esterase family CE10 [Pyrrhoderma noxium]|uniref:Carboxylic ester hydrolase n=1 Tax=Pyrrhoderma noxium TaxID=2282107 RepID=A0A286UA75_9AGAM|nr:sterol esterase from carbohydrate esterase family CE10 [Pyrrhoderma noxium]
MFLKRFSTLAVQVSLVCYCSGIEAFGASRTQQPTISLDYGSFQGTITGNLSLFLGIPFAQAPIGDLRFLPPQPPLTLEGVQNASTYGPVCPQSLAVLQNTSTMSVPGDISISEDCLSINVIKPLNVPDGEKLPVIFWIFGGGFETGGPSLYPGNTIVERSIALEEPIIYVSANYRLNAFGFLPGKEVLDSGNTNIGIRDQRFALEWVHDNIEKFGGDPSKVTIWGQSAGSISVALQLVLNDGDPEGLFRAAVMESGSLYDPKLDILGSQQFYDELVDLTGCSSSSNTLGCLRNVSMDTIVDAVEQMHKESSYSGLSTTWSPRIDGLILKSDPVPILKQGLYAKVPIVIGDVDDEGTRFSLAQSNITTSDEFLQYVKDNYLPNISQEDLLAIGEAYPDDPTQGSPFDTGSSNVVYPEFKRLAAFQGDLVQHAPRRFLLGTVSKTQDAWSYLYKRGKGTPKLGSSHGSDIPEFYSTNSTSDFIGTDILINFANSLNPTIPSNPISLLTQSELSWKRWNSSGTAPPLLTFLDPAPEISITNDTFRKDAIDLLNSIAVKLQGS